MQISATVYTLLEVICLANSQEIVIFIFYQSFIPNVEIDIVPSQSTPELDLPHTS